MRINLAGVLLLLAANGAVQAASPQDMLKEYEVQAKQEKSGFAGFSAARGEQLFRAKHTVDGKEVSCTTCHTSDPRQAGKTRANKEIKPMAPSVNAERFTDKAKTEKWFKRNCDDVLKRACTSEEKGDFITFLLTVK